MVILGIDPGTRVCGYGVIQTNPLQAIDYGCIRPPPKLRLEERYEILFDAIEHLIDRFTPGAIGVESQFMLKNFQSALKLGMAKAMVYLAAAKKKIPLIEISPSQAKLAVVGNGRASKPQVQWMIQSLLKLPHPPNPEDAADALAIAIGASSQLAKPLCMNRSKEH